MTPPLARRRRARRLLAAVVVPRPVALMGLAAWSMLVGGCSREIEAMRVLADLSAGAAPSVFKQVTPPPRRARVAYRRAGREYRADLYLPGQAETARARLVLVPGAAPAGRDDPRLVAFATTLARARFAVLVPDMPNLRAQRVTAADIRHIGDAAAHLAELPLQSEAPPLGVAAISYAVGPAFLAALESRPPARVAFVVGIGGYYDLVQVITFFTTGRYRDRDDAPWRAARPNEYGKWVFVLSNTHRIEDAHDRAVLERLARRKLDDPRAPTADLVDFLGPEGRSVIDVLANAEPARVPALVAKLPPGIRAEIAILDIARRELGGLETRLILVHGRDDTIIPYTESVRLHAAAPAGRSRLYLVDNLMHADLAAPGLWDAINLWRAVRQLLRERDGVAD